jgi:hypothetical protein
MCPPSPRLLPRQERVQRSAIYAAFRFFAAVLRAAGLRAAVLRAAGFAALRAAGFFALRAGAFFTAVLAIGSLPLESESFRNKKIMSKFDHFVDMQNGFSSSIYSYSTKSVA